MAIKSKDGRSRSKRTISELEDRLAFDLSTLSTDEKDVLRIMLAEMEDDQLPPGAKIIDAMGAAEYKREPVDMRTFVHDEYYLGNTCDTLYPVLLDDLTDLFEGGYHESIWTGSIGYGKTFASSIGVCRILYEISCMNNPHKSFGLATDSNISIVALSVNEALAIKVVFENVATKIKASPYFQEHFPFEPTKKELRFPGNVWVAARATTDGSVLGLNTISAIMDETNFLHKSKQARAADKRWGAQDSAEKLYAAIKRRMKSRFEKKGRLPGMIFIVSSKNTNDDFTERRIQAAKTDPSVWVRDYSLWDVKPDAYLDASRFWVLVGNEQLPSRILDDQELAEMEGDIPEGCVLVDVPEDFRMDFESDLEGAIRDIAGISTVSVSPFIQRREKIYEAVDDRKHPFTTLSYDPIHKGQFKWEEMVTDSPAPKYRAMYPDKRLWPIINPDAKRHVHIDPSLNSCATGFCMAHVGGLKDVVRRSDEGRQYVERSPVYIVDLILQIIPPPGGEIVLGDVRHIVYMLAEHGYLITHVTYDSYQSADSVQKLKSKGYGSELISMDLTPEPYDTLKAALYENRVYYYKYPPLLDELKSLQEDRSGKKRKIDHPQGGSKDCSDALAGVVFTLSRKALTQPLPFIRSTSYTEDPWMEEQTQAALAGQPGAGANIVMPAFFMGYGEK